MLPASACHCCLDQLKKVLTQFTNDEYRTPLPVLQSACVGAHVRHIIEFYQCLINQSVDRKINYDLRHRNPMLESSPVMAAEEITRIQEYLAETRADNTLVLEANLSEQPGVFCQVSTSLMREIVYQLEHTIHHMALLRVGISYSFPHIELPEGFGIASSTMRNTRLNSR